MTNKNKRTGSRNELELAKHLSKELGMDFQRTPHSGADPRYPGDISADEFPYTIECKSVRSFSFHNMYDGQHAQLTGWLQQAHKQSDRPLLIFKVSRYGWYAVQHLADWKPLSRHTQCVVYTVYGTHIIMALDKWINTYTRWSEYDNR